MKRLRHLLKDKRGQSPWVLMASVALFVGVSAGVATALVTSLTMSSTLETNEAIKRATILKVQEVVARGYNYAAAQPASLTLTDLTIGGGRTVPAIQTRVTHSSNLTVRITVMAGASNGQGRYADPATCTAKPQDCVISTEVVARPRVP